MSIDFSRNADIYDRRHGSVISEDLVSALTKAAGLKPGQPLLDLASGTGRVALGFARAGFVVTATDISADMLATLADKAEGIPLATQKIDGDRLPFPDESQPAISLARVLYLIPGWQSYLSEVHRVAAPAGVLLHEWGNGVPSSPWVRYREELRTRLARLGHANTFHPGVRTEAEIEAYLSELGWRCQASVPSGPGTSMTLGHFITMVETGEASYLWHVPDEIKTTLVPAMRDWASDSLGNFDQPIELPGGACWRVYRRV